MSDTTDIRDDDNSQVMEILTIVPGGFILFIF